jgi:hypothetical protein
MAQTARKYETRKVKLIDAVEEAMTDLEDLRDEMSDWAGNMEEKFSHTEKYERVLEAADALEQIQRPDVPDHLADSEIEIAQVLPRSKSKGLSRNDRRFNAISIIESVMEHLDQLENDSDAQTLRDELDQITSEADGVEFPGMYG